MPNDIDARRERLEAQINTVFGSQAEAARRLRVDQSRISKALKPELASDRRLAPIELAVDRYVKSSEVRRGGVTGEESAHIEHAVTGSLNGGKRGTCSEHDIYGAGDALQTYVRAIPIYRPMETNGSDHDVVARDVRELQRAYGQDLERVRRRYMVGDSMNRSIAPNTEVDCIPVERFEGPGTYYMHLDDRPVIATLQPISGGAWMIRYDNDRFMDDLLLPDPKTGGFKSERTGLPVQFRVYERVVGYRVSA